MLSSRTLYVVLSMGRSTWTNENSLPNVALFLQYCSIYTLTISTYTEEHETFYAHDMCVTAQYSLFKQVGELTHYYRNNRLRATQVTVFHLRNK